MRRFSIPLSLLALALTAVACGGDDSGESSDATTATTAPAVATTAAATAYPVTVSHAFGTTTVAAAPERVVALGVEDADIALALGTTPIAIPENRPLPVMPWTQALLDEQPLADGSQVQVLSFGSELPYEEIAALDPDLILAVMAGLDQTSYDQLTAIAPTIAHATEAYSDPWQDQTRLIGTVLGQEARADELVAGAEQSLAASAAEHPGLRGKTFSVSLISEPASFGLLTDAGAVTLQILAEYGMTQNPAITALGDDDASQLSLEHLELLDSDVTLVYWFDPALADTFAANPVWQQLDVVQRDAVVSVQDDVWRALRSPSVLSLPWVVDQLAPQIESAAGG